MSYKRSLNCLKVSAVAVLMLFFQVSSAQVNGEELGAIADEKARLLKGEVVLMVANKDTVLFQKDSKTFQATRGKAPIGYSSQLLTTALLLQLADEGKLSLDDKIATYLPEFARYGKKYITIRHCLTHHTGIQPNSRTKMFDKLDGTLEEEVNKLAARDIQANPGEEYRYNDKGFLIAARVAEVVTKKKFENLIQQKLVRPLGMRQTSFVNPDGSAPNPSHGATSSAADMILFLRMLLNEGKAKGVSILSPEAVGELRKIYFSAADLKGAPPATAGYDYALGAWAPEGSNGLASVLTVPSQGGSIPVVDFCRGYAFVYLLKGLSDDKKAEAYGVLKGSLDGSFPAACQ